MVLRGTRGVAFLLNRQVGREPGRVGDPGVAARSIEARPDQKWAGKGKKQKRRSREGQLLKLTSPGRSEALPAVWAAGHRMA